MRLPPLPPYRPPPGLRSGHAQTLLPSLTRRVPAPPYARTRIETPDGDFLDLDLARASPGSAGRRVAVISHGLEGNTGRAYVRGMARALNAAGWDALAWNMRGCSGEPNRLPRAYHSAATEDLDAVLRHAFGQGYAQAALVGFSLGGNLTLRWLGERGADADPRVVAAVAFSVPVDLASAGRTMARASRRLYLHRFLRTLRAKADAKAARFPDALPAARPRRMRTFADFDGHYTAPAHGFADAADYYARASSRPLLTRIARPALLVQAADDPFLSPACYPYPEAAANPCFHLAVTRYGGHVGFMEGAGAYWSERAAVAFLGAVSPGAGGAQAAGDKASRSAASSASPPSTA